MNKELQLEISRLREDIQSSEIKQVVPFINGRVNVSNPKGHLQTHLNTIERLIKEALSTPTADEIVNELNEYIESIWGIDERHPVRIKYSCGKIVGFINDTYLFITINFQGRLNFNHIGIPDFSIPLKLADKITTFFMNKSDE